MDITRSMLCAALALTFSGCATPGPTDANGNTPAYHVIDLGPDSSVLSRWDPNPLEGTPFEDLYEKDRPSLSPDLPDHFKKTIEQLVVQGFQAPISLAWGAAVDIDEEGRVVGRARRSLETGGHHNTASIATKGSVWHFGLGESSPMGMNDHLQVVGTRTFDSIPLVPFLWNGTTGIAEVLPTDRDYVRVPTAINNDGTIVGFTSTSSGFEPFRMLDGVVETLPTVYNRTFANDINKTGIIVGRERVTGRNVALKWEGGVRTVLKGETDGDDLPVDSVANAVSDSGSIVGRIGTRPVMWTVFGGIVSLAPGVVAAAEALDVNTQSEAVGTVQGGWRNYAFHSPGFKLLDDHIDQSLGWQLDEAVAINDSGWITGSGFINGRRHMYLLVPWSQLPHDGGVSGPLLPIDLPLAPPGT